MALLERDTLREGHRKATGLAEEDRKAEIARANDAVLAYVLKDERAELLAGVPPHIVKKAWFMMAHLLLFPGARVADIGCGDGQMAYTMAVLFPHLSVVGVDINRKAIDKARSRYQRPNLDFVVSDTTRDDLPDDSFDAIVDSFVLHEIYSGSRFSDRLVTRTLENHFRLLKTGGQIIIRDFAMPPPDEYVLMEMPDAESTGDSLSEMSEADLLEWFSEQARIHDDDSYSGFFLEELPPRFPRTRLFRLPHKWAYEFIMRKDDRARWEDELPKEYTFYTERDYVRELTALGARVLYCAPHWDETLIKASFEGHFRLYTDDGAPLGPPATSYIVVAQKIGTGSSLSLVERRSSRNRTGPLHVQSMRNESNGVITDIVTRDMELVEVLPYRVAEGGDLRVFLHEGAPRGIVNAVLRSGKNLDGKRWSGHMTEAIALDARMIEEVEEGDIKDILAFTRGVLGLRPAIGSTLETGPSFYPDPNTIDERIETRYLRIESANGPIPLKMVPEDMAGFSTAGRIREFRAQDVLNAIAVGFLPNGRLETQIRVLYDRAGLKAENWNESPLLLPDKDPETVTPVKDLLTKMSEEDKRFKSSKGTAGKIRVVQSVFVDEGRSTEGGAAGLASRDLSFMVPEDGTENIAVVLPLTRDKSGEVMAGIIADFFPVPQRYKGSGFMVTAPSFPLPRDVTNLEQARRYVAEKFGVDPTAVSKMGESYFCHTGVTPVRIYPFAVATAGGGCAGFVHGPTSYTPLKYVGALLGWDCDSSFIGIASRAYNLLCQDNEQSLVWDFGHRFSDEKAVPLGLRASVLSGLTADISVDTPHAPQVSQQQGGSGKSDGKSSGGKSGSGSGGKSGGGGGGAGGASASFTGAIFGGDDNQPDSGPSSYPSHDGAVLRAPVRGGGKASEQKPKPK